MGNRGGGNPHKLDVSKVTFFFESDLFQSSFSHRKCSKNSKFEQDPFRKK